MKYLHLLGSFPLDGHLLQINVEIFDRLLLAPNFMNSKDIVKYTETDVFINCTMTLTLFLLRKSQTENSSCMEKVINWLLLMKEILDFQKFTFHF